MQFKSNFDKGPAPTDNNKSIFARIAAVGTGIANKGKELYNTAILEQPIYSLKVKGENWEEEICNSEDLSKKDPWDTLQACAKNYLNKEKEQQERERKLQDSLEILKELNQSAKPSIRQLIYDITEICDDKKELTAHTKKGEGEEKYYCKLDLNNLDKSCVVTISQYFTKAGIQHNIDQQAIILIEDITQKDIHTTVEQKTRKAVALYRLDFANTNIKSILEEIAKVLCIDKQYVDGTTHHLVTFPQTKADATSQKVIQWLNLDIRNTGLPPDALLPLHTLKTIVVNLGEEIKKCENTVTWLNNQESYTWQVTHNKQHGLIIYHESKPPLDKKIIEHVLDNSNNNNFHLATISSGVKAIGFKDTADQKEIINTTKQVLEKYHSIYGACNKIDSTLKEIYLTVYSTEIKIEFTSYNPITLNCDNEEIAEKIAP